MKNIGYRLKYALKKKGFTKNSLAESIGVSRGLIFNLEKNKTDPQSIVINAICQTLKIQKNWLIDGTGEMEDKTESSRSTQILSELYEVAKSLSEDEQLYLLDVVKSLKKRLNRPQ